MNDRFFAERFFLIFSKYFDFATVRLPDQTATLPITWRDFCYNIPTPVKGEGGGGGDKTKLSNSIFIAWKPWDSDPTPQMEL